MYVAGRVVPGVATADPRSDRSRQPGEVVARVAEGTVDDAERAIAEARAAFDAGTWPEMPALDRARLLMKLADRSMPTPPTSRGWRR